MDNKRFLFSQSPVWQLQNQYFEEAHVNAWSNGEVPHYVTSNPKIAAAYAEMILAFLRDRQAMNDGNEEPVYILELGAGSGRFSFHLLKALSDLCAKLPGLKQSFVYIISDYVEKNIAYWQQHPRLIPYFESGLLDCARFDAEKDSAIHLRKGKRTITEEALSQPLLVIANYFFDSIPQELFYFQNGAVKNVFLEESAEETDDLTFTYSYEALKKFSFEDPLQNEIAEKYRSSIQNSHLLFPHTGLTCLSRLRRLSNKGLLLLTADKGVHRPEELEGRELPQFIQHGSFSLTVNYHAFKLHCERMKGKTLFPKHPYSHINIGCLLYLHEPGSYSETQAAYERAIDNFGPDEYFSIKKHIEKQIPRLSLRELFAYLRLSAYDSRLFAQLLLGFRSKRTFFTDTDRFTFLQAAAKVWDGYYPIREEKDLAFDIGDMLADLYFFREALSFFQLSEKIYGKTAEVLYRQALCLISLQDADRAATLLTQAIRLAPGNTDIQQLFDTLRTGTIR